VTKPEVLISLKAQSVQSFLTELAEIEAQQLALGFRMGELVDKQMTLAKKSKALKESIGKLIK
jgi:hypothetical protein